MANKTKKDQATMLREAREELGLTNAQMAERLGVAVSTFQSWLEPETSKSRRNMPKTAQLLLQYVLTEYRTARHAGKP